MSDNKNSFLIPLLCVVWFFAVSSTAAAADWEAVSFPITDQPITGITSRGGDTIMVVTGSGVFARTSDAGRTWETHLVTSHSLEDVSFASRLVGMACGRNSGIYTTTDGGRTWADRSLKDTTPALISIQMFDPFKALAVGLSRDTARPFVGVAYRTDDGGKRWTSLRPLGQGYGDIAFVGGRTAFLSWGSLNVSADSGATWMSVPMPNGKPPRAVAVRGNKIIAVGNLSAIYVSNDGKNWREGKVILSGHFTSVVIVNDTLAFTGGTAGALFKSADGGLTWQQVVESKPFDILDMCLAGNYVWAVGKDGNIMRTKVK